MKPKLNRNALADVLLLVGSGNLVVAGFLLGAVWGFATIGLCCAGLAYLISGEDDET